MMSELISKYEPIIDTYLEHMSHEFVQDNCSECYKEKACANCGRIADEETTGRYCSKNCREESDADWAYDSSIGN